jgi:hypothetical protein
MKESIYFFPVVFDSIQKQYQQTEILFDSTQCVASKFVPIEEREGYGKRLNGTRGKNIRAESKKKSN